MSRDDLIIKKERERISQLKAKSANLSRQLKSLDFQYKQVILELRRQLNWYKNNAWKATFVSGYNRLKEVMRRD